jgi:hypothetical protein
MMLLMLTVLTSTPSHERVVSLPVIPWFSKGIGVEIEQYTADTNWSIAFSASFVPKISGDFSGLTSSVGLEAKRFLPVGPWRQSHRALLGGPFLFARAGLSITHLASGSRAHVGSVVIPTQQIGIGYRAFLISFLHFSPTIGLFFSEPIDGRPFVQFSFGASLGFAL